MEQYGGRDNHYYVTFEFLRIFAKSNDMKVKLTLNIEDTIIRKTKVFSKKRNKSISAIVEDYLEKITSKKNNENSEEPFSQHFRKLFPSKPDKHSDYKKAINEYREEKYGGK